MDNFVGGTKKHKERIFLKYLKAYDWLIQDRVPKMRKYVVESELKADAVFAIEMAFNRAHEMMVDTEPNNVDLLYLFKGFFCRTTRQNKRDNLPMTKEKRDEFLY